MAASGDTSDEYDFHYSTSDGISTTFQEVQASLKSAGYNISNVSSPTQYNPQYTVTASKVRVSLTVLVSNEVVIQASPPVSQ
jgi:hypothetical protein